MRASLLKTGWLWVFSGGLTLALTGLTHADEPQVKEEKPVKEEQAVKDLLRPFTISKETTRITEPLKPDGTVDYAAALNARNSEGLTPENNAGVLLMQAMGADAVPEANRERFYKSLGVAAPQSGGASMKDLGQFVKPHLKAQGIATEGQNAYQPFWDQQSQAMSRPWSRKEFPLVANWVDGNAGALTLAVQASQKDRIFIPIIVGEKETLIEASIDGVQNIRSIARLLTARAMLSLEAGQVEEAQADLLACHRLASLFGQRSMMIQALVSYALDATACRADLALAQSEKVTPEQLAAYRKKLEELPALPTMSETIDQGERFFSLDAISNLATQKIDGAELGVPNSGLFKRMLGLSIDWDLIMKQFNEEYDQMSASLKSPSHAARQAAIAKWEAKLKKLREEASQPAQFALMFLGVDPPRAVVSRNMGNTLLLLLVPAIQQASEAELRMTTRRHMTIIAFALAEYQRNQGKYPESLSDLSPKYLKSLPDDRFTGKPLKYQRQDAGYLLYSQGANGKDDKGQDRAANPQSDDWSIRVPLQPEL